MTEIFERIKTDFSTLDKRVVFALVYTAFGLTCIYYFKNPEWFAMSMRSTPFAEFAEFVARSPTNNLSALSYWVAIVSIFYFIVPASVIRLVYGEPLSNYGLKFSIERGFWKLLVVCMAVMLPLVYTASLTPGFSAKYPFLNISEGGSYLGWTLLCWELLYFIQFFGLEFFFRGFLVHSLKPSLGMYSIFFMTVPYCMIHFGKPPAETFAAIVAGIFLGWLSYKTRNIWFGVVLHCSVAFTMDILALYGKGLLFS